MFGVGARLLKKAASFNEGFTLIELLVVLVIVVMTGAFVGPNMWQQYTKFSERAVVQDVADLFYSLRRSAYANGRVIELNDRSGEVKAALPQEWGVTDMSVIYFLPSGVTSGGYVDFESSTGAAWRLVLKPLDGSVEIERL